MEYFKNESQKIDKSMKKQEQKNPIIKQNKKFNCINRNKIDINLEQYYGLDKHEQKFEKRMRKAIIYAEDQNE